jgi:hypothetical protein
MIEQTNNTLTLTFPSEQAATQAKRWMEMAVVPWLPIVSQGPEISLPPSGPAQPTDPLLTPASPEPVPSRSRHTVLTPERQEQLFNQRQSGQTAHQRLLRAQTTLRDGTLPFSRPASQPPSPTGQDSPRQRAAAEGGFADGSGEEPEAARLRGRSRLRPVAPTAPQPFPKP